ncbi:MAG: hypothetical protein H6633_12705 [Anaerolineales bacterium]|nr:hypothetical protein [Anaerolineales bacterium]
MSEIEVMLNDTAVIRDFPEHQEGAFLELLNRLSSVLDKVTGNIAKEINRLGYKLRDFALEGDEEVVLSKCLSF